MHGVAGTLGQAQPLARLLRDTLCGLERAPLTGQLLAHVLQGPLGIPTGHAAAGLPGGALRRFLVDTVVHDVEVLRGLVDFFGVEHVLLGSDYPFDMGVERPAEIVRALELPPEDEAAILGGNALRLFGVRQESPA